jgi:hypothetical protein
MRRFSFFFAFTLLATAVAGAVTTAGQTVPDVTAAGTLTVINTVAEPVTFKGTRAVRLREAQPGTTEQLLAVVKEVQFSRGTIELDVAGEPGPNAGEGARGFIGIAFHVQPGAARYEFVYLRPTNGRADDQVRRNHSTQYASYPDFPWQRLRKEFPEKYESYVDLEPGVWTHIRVEVQNNSARLFVRDAPQPALVVNDLKLDATSGGVGLWIGPGTIGHFANLRVH